MERPQTRIAIIGGSGLAQVPGMTVVEEFPMETPFGRPSDVISVWRVDGQAVAFPPRHGRGHRLLPSEVPSRANIWALKSLGVEQIIAFSAVGSLREDMRPGDFVLCDQLIDRTRGRASTFFGDGLVGHVGFAEPYCGRMRRGLSAAVEAAGMRHHAAGTLVVMEGPQFSSRAESALHRSWGADLIGMTALPEAKLAREAQMCMAVVAMVTDYDCWHEEAEEVSAGLVERVMTGNSETAGALIPGMVSAVTDGGDCACRHAAEGALMTDPAVVPQAVRRRLGLFYPRLLERS